METCKVIATYGHFLGPVCSAFDHEHFSLEDKELLSVCNKDLLREDIRKRRMKGERNEATQGAGLPLNTLGSMI